MRRSGRYNGTLVTRTPPEPPDEELDELDDEAIVAQQSAAHAPQRRAQVKLESRSVVVADDDTEATRQLEVYTEGSSDPTLVVRDRERHALAQAVRDLPSSQTGKKSRVALAIWGAAGLLAFGLGAVLATVRGGATPSVVKVSPAASPASHQPVAVSPPVAAQVTSRDAAVPSASAAEPALDLDQLPVERGHKAKVRSGQQVRPKRARPKPSTPATAPEKGAIPSGI